MKENEGLRQELWAHKLGTMALHRSTIANHVIWFLCDLCALGGEVFSTRPAAYAHQSRSDDAGDAGDAKLEN